MQVAILLCQVVPRENLGHSLNVRFSSPRRAKGRAASNSAALNHLIIGTLPVGESVSFADSLSGIQLITSDLAAAYVCVVLKKVYQKR